jgi:hypothetical protein
MDVATDDEVEFLGGRVRAEIWWLFPVDSFHASHGGETGVLSIAGLRIIEGGLPKRIVLLVILHESARPS